MDDWMDTCMDGWMNEDSIELQFQIGIHVYWQVV